MIVKQPRHANTLAQWVGVNSSRWSLFFCCSYFFGPQLLLPLLYNHNVMHHTSPKMPFFTLCHTHRKNSGNRKHSQQVEHVHKRSYSTLDIFPLWIQSTVIKLMTSRAKSLSVHAITTRRHGHNARARALELASSSLSKVFDHLDNLYFFCSRFKRTKWCFCLKR